MKITNALEEKLSSLLLMVGIMPSVVGYEYIKTAVRIYPECEGNMNLICSQIANKNIVTKGSVERNIRTALLTAYNRGYLIRLNELLGFDIITESDKLTAKEFIAILSEYITYSHAFNEGIE